MRRREREKTIAHTELLLLLQWQWMGCRRRRLLPSSTYWRSVVVVVCTSVSARLSVPVPVPVPLFHQCVPFHSPHLPTRNTRWWSVVSVSSVAASAASSAPTADDYYKKRCTCSGGGKHFTSLHFGGDDHFNKNNNIGRIKTSIFFFLFFSSNCLRVCVCVCFRTITSSLTFHLSPDTSDRSDTSWAVLRSSSWKSSTSAQFQFFIVAESLNRVCVCVLHRPKLLYTFRTFLQVSFIFFYSHLRHCLSVLQYFSMTVAAAPQQFYY